MVYLLVGDLHGDYECFEKVFEIAKEYNPNKIVFLGDYVDRGVFDYKILKYIYLWLNNKTIFGFEPNKIVFLRGNHENIEINKLYGFYYRRNLFYSEIGKRVDIQNEIYERLPLYYLERGKFLALHGFLPCKFNLLECPFIENCKEEILWNDFDPNIKRCKFNYYRGIGNIVGYDVWEKAKRELNVKLLFKGHFHRNYNYKDIYEVNSNNIIGKAKVAIFDGNNVSYIDL